MLYYMLSDKGEPIPCTSLKEWDAWYTSCDRHIGYDRIGRARVSTVFLGINHAFNGGPPALWETMVFGGPHDGYQERYTSKLAAEAGHKRICDMVRKQ